MSDRFPRLKGLLSRVLTIFFVTQRPQLCIGVREKLDSGVVVGSFAGPVL